jgi:hypothetical protein
VAAACRTGTGHAREAEITNLSEAGCRLELDGAALDPEQHVVVRPERLEGLSGVVRWSSGAAAGIEFDGALHPAIVDHIAGERDVLGYPAMAPRSGAAFTDRFGRALPALKGSRRQS